MKARKELKRVVLFWTLQGNPAFKAHPDDYELVCQWLREMGEIAKRSGLVPELTKGEQA